MVRGLLILALAILLIGSASAGELQISSSGSTYTVDWFQGCPAETLNYAPGYTFATDPSGPNACVTTGGNALPPYYCPADSTGGLGGDELVQNCEECGCGFGQFCDDGSCISCEVEPCAVCQPGQVCGRYHSPTESDPCRVLGSCYWPPIDYGVEMKQSSCFGWCTEFTQTNTGTLYSQGSYRDYVQTIYVFGAPSCQQTVRVRHEGDRISCTQIDAWGSCGKSYRCWSDAAFVTVSCSGVGSMSREFTVNVPRGSSRSFQTSCSLLWQYGEARITVSRSSAGTVSCSLTTLQGNPPYFGISECK